MKEFLEKRRINAADVASQSGEEKKAVMKRQREAAISKLVSID